ncbi:hypothetical protein AJ79_06438 [Helicocarpus griseus UAMH5409]|uniref:Knr4/Smi1-like domain-containing protein n=1 Tax=Helicocarpus griseus UAMH5409 TaxID=1447875 RepID=A0A2B7XCD2_9EURO|nr:hypothetical protein AJ79_06438 [Helicocarpus griseus UAMH5409]
MAPPSISEQNDADSNTSSFTIDNDGIVSIEIDKLRAVFATKDVIPPLGWPAVHAFESKHNIILPEPYRTFVAEIANGCREGPPHYGLVSLGHSGSNNIPVECDLSSPFPLTRKWIWEDDPQPPEAFPMYQLEEDGPDLSCLGRGCLELGTDGCGMDWYLIVTGEHRGQIWNIADVGAGPFGAPFGNTTAQPGFAGWVLHWAAGKEWWLDDEE